MPKFIGYVVAETDRALLFQDHYWTAPDWMPKSQVEQYRDPDAPMELQLEASAWICGQKNIKEFRHYVVDSSADKK